MSTNPQNSLALLSAQLPANISALTRYTGQDDLSAGVTGGFPVLSIRGSKWRMVQSGEETPIMIPGTTDMAPSVHVVLLKANPAVSKTFYASAYVEGSDAAPDCFSSDGEAPDAGSPKPQSKSCATCQHSQWGSKITPAGKKSKACADVRRVAVLPDGDLDHSPILLRVPAASLSGLAEYGKALRRAGAPYSAVVTKMSFDPTAAYPLILFQFSRVLKEEEIAKVAQRVTDPAVEDVVDADLFGAGATELPVASYIPPLAAPAAEAPAAARKRRSAAPGDQAPAPPVSNVVPMPAPVAPPATPAPVFYAPPAAPAVSSGDIGADIDSALAALSL